MFDSPQNNQFSQQKSQKKNSLRSLVLILGFFAIASLGIITLALLQKWNVPASAAPGIYKALNYQGKLEDTGGIPVADGPYNIIFTIYDAASGGNVLWTASESDAVCGAPFTPQAKSVTVSKGVFSTMLGESGDCPLDLNFNDDSYYLGMTVGADSEMTPRKRIGAAGYAFNADLLDGLNTSLVGGTSSFVPATDASGNFVLTGNVTFDTNTFLLDATNDNIGIGISPTPMAKAFIDTDKIIALMSQTSAASGRAISASASATTGTTFAGSFSAGPAPMFFLPGMNVGVFASGFSDTQNGYGGYFMGDNYGIYATENEASGYGVYGASSGGNGRGIFGEATSPIGTTYGVYGQATGTLAANYGGYFSAAGPGGYGVYGAATDATGGVTLNYGGYFTAAGTGVSPPLGFTAGVYGEATSNAAVANVGGYFVSRGTGNQASGVLGLASDNGDVENYGGLFVAQGQKARGVYGMAYNSGAFKTYGVKGSAKSIGAGTAGVSGYVEGEGDNLYGVEGRGGNFFLPQGDGAYTNYGGYFTAAGQTGRAVYGWAENSGNYTNYGGYFEAHGGTGVGVYGVGWDTTSTNYGGYFLSRGPTGRGVYGEANSAGGLTNYGGYFIAAGSSATAVYGEATATDGANNIGGFFKADGNAADSYGVYALASGAGNNFGIFASTLSATGWAGYFNGGRGIYAYRFSINDGVSIVDYNTIGPAGAGHTAAGEITDQNDLFINGDLEIDGWAWLDGGHTDLAEMVAYGGEGEAGDVIVIDDQSDNSAKLAVKPYDKTVLGVISTKPSLIITGGIDEGKLLAIAGRVPTKVTNINGAIHRGDLLTTSFISGHAMKATEAGPIVGKAMGECSENSCVIWVFLNISWYGGM